ncbi:mucin-19 isoform X3 [Anopheles stephensi]|uniref:mucin-19 isoform X3 n=1 Tax=Anopheles stephensi TaxID=30069 RepID=UPI0016588049|nr:mucin-19 isoform X3 [Anopheles stephensi]
MSTLTNNANNSNNNNNNNNIIINNNGSGSNSASIQQQQQQHHQFSPQGSTPPTSTSGAVGTAYSTTSNSFNNNFHASDCINIINNNLSSSSSNTTANQSHPTATTTSTTASSSTSSGGVVSGILGVQEFSAKLFLPFSRSKMMHSTSINATTDSSGTMDGTMAGAGPSSKGAAGNAFTGASSTGSGTGRSGGGSTLVIPEVLNVVLHGYQRKLKTNKKKYFVVYGDRPGKPARLEYFDSEKKFKQSFMKGGGCEGPSAKRSISLRSCFNINKRHDSKKHIIALFTKDDCFCIVFESENEMTRWLRILLRLQRGEESEGDPPRPTFEHVWDVYVQRKGLGDSYGILGTYRLCITDKTLSLVRIGPEFTPQQEKRAANVDFSLASIRRCGHSQRYFYLEVGRSTKTGAGEIWMEVQDSIIAQNMYTTIMKSAKSKDDNLGPMIRIRSSSANAASKPTSMLFRRQTHTGQKPINCSPSSEDQSNNAQNSESSSSAASINTVVLVGSPPKGTASSGAPNSKPRPVVVANPNLPVCAENSLLGSCATSAANSATAPSATTATFGTACTSVATTITSVTTVTSSVATASMASSAMYPTTPDASYQHAPTIVPFAGHASASAAAACSTFTPGAMFTCSHSSNSSLTSIGSCSPIDAYVPLLPGAGRSTSPNQHPLSCAAVATGGGAAGAVGSGATVSGRGGLVGSPRLGVTAQSPSYRRTSLKKPVSENCPSRTAKMEASPVLSSTPRGGQQSRHYHQQQQHLHGTTASMLPPAASHLSHHHTLAQHPHHHHHPYLHPGTQAPLTSAVVATGAVVGHPATPNSVAGLLHAATGVVGTSSCSSSRSNSSSSSNSTSTIAVTNEFSSSSTDHGVAIARERCDSLPSRNRTTSETMPHQQQQQQQQQQQLQQQQQYQQHHQQLQHHQLMLNSGGMPPPRMIPSSNRPHSVHISHSHSPPVNSSPLSPPPPATYSTGSDGSSLSIDESTDSFITGSLTPDEGNGYPKVINQLNSGCSIPEENSEEFIKDYGHIDLRAGCGFSQHDDFAVPNHHTTPSGSSGRHGHHHHNSLSLPISQAARRGGSPAPPSTVGSVEGSAYMEMCSPSGSSPGDPSGSCYMAMSPVADFSRGLCSSSSAHSRASSLAEDMVDGSGYVPMSMPRAVPPAEEYVLMDPTLNGGAGSRLSSATSGGGTGNNGGGGSGMGGGGMSSAASSCSITSGTPSTDLRLSLEKVPAYIGQSDDHEVNDRPFRTYSVGSRPELIKRKLRVEMLSSGDSSVGGSAGGSASSRQRAFSVGSRAKVPRCSDVYKGYSAAPVIVSFASTSSQGSMLESSNNNSSSSTSSISHAGSFGASIGDTLPMDELGAIGRKSGSGSLLPDGNGKPPSHGSHGRMSDLMEIDYSSPRQVKPSTRTSEPAGMEDYLDMSGNGNNNEEDRRAGAPSATSGYVEMRPGRVNSQCEENDYLNMTPGSIAASSRVGIDEPDCPVGGSGSAKPTSSPIQINSAGPTSTDTATSGSSAGQNNNYLEMYPRALAKDTNRGSAAATKVPSEDYLNMAPLMISSLGDASGSEEKMATHQQHGGGGEDESLESSSAPDGYMEMSWNHGVVTTGSSSSSSNNRAERNVPTNGDDYMNMSCGPPPPSQSEDAFRAYSAPITIQPSAGKCRLDLSGESKVEAGANIPNYLPLGQHPDARKSVHHHHHPHAPPATIVALQQHLPLSAQAPIQTTTGQQSGSIGFSPASKPVTETPERARCDSRDSGIVTPSGSQPTIFPFSPASPTKPFAPGQAQQDEPMVESLENLSQNYAELSLGRQQLQQQQQQQQQHQGDPSPATRKLSAGSRGSVSFSKLQLLSTGSFSQPDYVNFCPTTPPVEGMNVPLNVQPSRTRIEDDGAGDYALMNPASSRKLSTTSMGAAAGGTAGTHTSPLAPSSLGSSSSSADGVSPPVLVARKSTLLLSSPQMGFKPITSSQDAELLLHSKLPMPSANSPKALNLARRSGEPAFNFNTEQQLPPLQRSISTGTRPNSVNSELIGKGCGATTPGPNTGSTTTIPGSAASTRPSSANSERLPIISATSSSASSTSTLCESKNQSPSASSTALTATTATTTSPSVPGSRPDSVSSITDPNIVSRPPSVSSERELHYASLDLPPCSKQTPVASPFSAGTMMLLSGGGGGASGINIAGGGSSSSSAVGGVTKMDVDEPLPGANESRSSIDSITSSSPSPSSSGCNLHQQQQQQQQPVRCAAFTYAKIDFVRSQAQKQHQPAGGSGPAGSTGSGSTSTPQSSQA